MHLELLGLSLSASSVKAGRSVINPCLWFCAPKGSSLPVQCWAGEELARLTLTGDQAQA